MVVTQIASAIERIVGAMATLASTAEPITDEWTYVQDLETVWVARLRAVAAARIHAAPRGFESAIDGLIAEIDRIEDPHRAIDWLSTLPQAVLVALGEEAW